jgi:hypothetical protein
MTAIEEANQVEHPWDTLRRLSVEVADALTALAAIGEDRWALYAKPGERFFLNIDNCELEIVSSKVDKRGRILPVVPEWQRPLGEVNLDNSQYREVESLPDLTEADALLEFDNEGNPRIVSEPIRREAAPLPDIAEVATLLEPDDGEPAAS